MKRRMIGLGIVFVVAIAVSPRELAEDGAQRARPKTYGTSHDSIYHVPINEFVPYDSSWGTKDYFFPGSLARFSPGCTGSCFYAVPRLPNGALLTGIEAYFCNTEPNHNYLLGVELHSSWYDGTNSSYLDAVYSASSNGCGEFEILDLTPLNYQVNWYDNQLFLVGRIDKSDGTQAFSGVNLYYRLQVSPAPVAAAFADVPTSHPFYQFVEALYASGITGGCGNGNYCPDAPLTRGQMAVFLAKALGLQWP